MHLFFQIMLMGVTLTNAQRVSHHLITPRDRGDMSLLSNAMRQLPHPYFGDRACTPFLPPEWGGQTLAFPAEIPHNPLRSGAPSRTCIFVHQVIHCCVYGAFDTSGRFNRDPARNRTYQQRATQSVSVTEPARITQPTTIGRACEQLLGDDLQGLNRSNIDATVDHMTARFECATPPPNEAIP